MRPEANTSDNLVVKLNQTLSTPTLNFAVKKGETIERELTAMLDGSVFKEHIVSCVYSSASVDKENSKHPVKRTGKISSDSSCVISGLKCFLTELGQDLLTNISEDFFNLAAKPFVPKVVKQANGTAPMDIASFAAANSKSAAAPAQSSLDPEQ